MTREYRIEKDSMGEVKVLLMRFIKHKLNVP